MVAHAAILFSEEMGRGALLLRWLPCATHNDFAARWLAYMLPCRRFADVLADACARLGADVGRYSFIVVDFHHILLAGLPAHSLALRPAHSRRHQIRNSYPRASDISSPPCLPRLLPAGAVAGWASR